MSLEMHIFRVGEKAVVAQEISHWEVIDVPTGRALVVSMRNGGSVSFHRAETPTGVQNAYQIEQGLVDFLKKAGRR